MILGQDCDTRTYHSSLGVMTGKNFKQFELLTTDKMLNCIILPLCLFNFYFHRYDCAERATRDA